MNAQTETYNGWTNRETWATALHISNDQGLEDTAAELTRDAADVYRLADALECFVDEVLDDDHVRENPHAFMMLTDIGSLWRVDWREIAANYWEVYREDEDSDD
jgi:hypothetical protein